MSLRVDDRSGRSRGRSPSGGNRDRSRSRSNVRAPDVPIPPAGSTVGYPSNGYSRNEVTSPTSYEVRSPQSGVADRSSYFPAAGTTPGAYPTPQPAPAYPAAPSAPAYPQAQMPYAKESDGGFTMGDYKDFPPHERPGYYQRDSYSSQMQNADSGLAYHDSDSGHYSRHGSYDNYPPQSREPDRYNRQGSYDSYPPQPNEQGQYSRHNSYDSYPPSAPQPPRPAQPPQAPRPPQGPGQQNYQYYKPEPVGTDSRSSSYKYQYAQPPDKITYNTQPHAEQQYGQHPQSPPSHYSEQHERIYSQSNYEQPQRGFSQSSYDQHQRTYSQSAHDQPQRSYSQTAYDQNPNVVDITPYGSKPGSRPGPPPSRPSLDHRTSGAGLQAPGGLTASLGRLSVGGAPSATGGELPPPSPLLEAYRGTYQQMSPLPLALRPADEDELSDLEPLSPTISHTSSKAKHGEHKGVKIAQEAIVEKKGKRVTVYDPEEDAKTISKALSHSKIDGEAISDVLPHLTHDQIMYLRKEYKKQVKVQGKGVNLSKHLKTKLTGNFGKVVYVTALGRWESEGYWANFFYQSHGSRRELLIEALMGRSNAEIWNIKDEFKDKRYSDDLVKCMEKELKMDKFRTAVLLVLEEQRQEEQDIYPPEYRMKDVETLHKALTAPKGGESTMLEIIVLRSDAHLREVLKLYERTYQENFPRAALKKSNNLVGEVIAHILNGAINKPARDALLLRHAIEDVAEKNKDEELRYELLISRLVRFHWDKLHFMRVKREYENKYGSTVEEEIEEATKGDFQEFLCQLCEVK